MPKIKTSSGAKKRFKVTGAGKLLRKQGMLSHNLGKMSRKRKRRLGGDAPISGANERAVLGQLGKR